MNNMNRDICDFSLLTRKACSHCNRPAKYELRPFLFKGNRMVEILRDGGPVHPYDKHFQFGIKKAKLLLVALSITQEFAANPLDDGNWHIGLGVQKAKAVCAVAHQLREWVANGDALQKRATIHLTLGPRMKVEYEH